MKIRNIALMIPMLIIGRLNYCAALIPSTDTNVSTAPQPSIPVDPSPPTPSKVGSVVSGTSVQLPDGTISTMGLNSPPPTFTAGSSSSSSTITESSSVSSTSDPNSSTPATTAARASLTSTLNSSSVVPSLITDPSTPVTTATSPGTPSVLNSNPFPFSFPFQIIDPSTPFTTAPSPANTITNANSSAYTHSASSNTNGYPQKGAITRTDSLTFTTPETNPSTYHHAPHPVQTASNGKPRNTPIVHPPRSGVPTIGKSSGNSFTQNYQTLGNKTVPKQSNVPSHNPLPQQGPIVNPPNQKSSPINAPPNNNYRPIHDIHHAKTKSMSPLALALQILHFLPKVARKLSYFIKSKDPKVVTHHRDTFAEIPTILDAFHRGQSVDGGNIDKVYTEKFSMGLEKQPSESFLNFVPVFFTHVNNILAEGEKAFNSFNDKGKTKSPVNEQLVKIIFLDNDADFVFEDAITRVNKLFNEDPEIVIVRIEDTMGIEPNNVPHEIVLDCVKNNATKVPLIKENTYTLQAAIVSNAEGHQNAIGRVRNSFFNISDGQQFHGFTQPSKPNPQLVNLLFYVHNQASQTINDPQPYPERTTVNNNNNSNKMNNNNSKVNNGTGWNTGNWNTWNGTGRYYDNDNDYYDSYNYAPSFHNDYDFVPFHDHSYSNYSSDYSTGTNYSNEPTKTSDADPTKNPDNVPSKDPVKVSTKPKPLTTSDSSTIHDTGIFSTILVVLAMISMSF